MGESDAIFTKRELDVMGVLWAKGSGTVAEVQEGIEDPLAYTTVLTVLRTLEQKEYVEHQSEGRAYRYFPKVPKQKARESHLNRLMGSLFSDSPELMITQLVSDRKLSKDELKRLRSLLDEKLS